MYLLACAAMLFGAYLLNITFITVFYHRALAHDAVVLHPVARSVVIHTGNWITGLDPKGWVCMHRLHHLHSDDEGDPHSPVRAGIFGVLLAQLNAYERILVGLARGEHEYTRMVEDLDFDISWLNRKKLWYLPYVVHGSIGAVLGLATGAWLLGLAYFVGMMSHPIQGWLVNAFAHALGSRNFDTPDNSRNNTLIALTIFGEGYQNNHHRYPNSARFSYLPTEIDPGYGLCLALEAVGALEIDREKLLPSPLARA